MRKSLWSPDEDEKLRRYVATHGCGNWSDVAKHTGLQRCGKSCRLRWINYLRPDLKRGPFSVDEVRLVVNLHNNLGNSWSKIASYLPGRTDNDVKNFWHSYTRGRRLQQNSSGNDPNDKKASSELAKCHEQPITIINKPKVGLSFKGINVKIASGLQQIKRSYSDTTTLSQQIKCDPHNDWEYQSLGLIQEPKNYSMNDQKHIIEFGHESFMFPLASAQCKDLQSEINEAAFVYTDPLQAYDINTLSYSEMAQMAGSLINPLISLKPPLMSLIPQVNPQMLGNRDFSSMPLNFEDKPPEGLQSVIWSFLNRQSEPASYSGDRAALNQQLAKQSEPDDVLIDHNIEPFTYANMQYSQAQLAGCFS